MKARNTITNNIITFLVDTGADISLLNQSNREYSQLIDPYYTIISGIGKGTIKSLGSMQLDLKIEIFLIPHEFQVVHRNFPIPCDGIQGIDFIKKYNCVLEFSEDQDWFIIRPARSEVISRVCLVTNEEEVLVINQEPQLGIMIDCTIVDTKNTFKLNRGSIATESLTNYDIIDPKYLQNERKEKMHSRLGKNRP